jgi:hypothetical protein
MRDDASIPPTCRVSGVGKASDRAKLGIDVIERTCFRIDQWLAHRQRLDVSFMNKEYRTSLSSERHTGIGHFWTIKVPLMMRRCDRGLGVRVNIVSSIVDVIRGVIGGTTISPNIYQYSLRLPSFSEAEPDEDTDDGYEYCTSHLIVNH